MKKLIAKIDVTKINKEKIIDRKYQKDGKEVIAKELDLELVPLRSEKIVHRNGERMLMKIGFVSEKSVKKEDGTYENGNIIGDIMEWRDDDGLDVIDPENIPF